MTSANARRERLRHELRAGDRVLELGAPRAHDETRSVGWRKGGSARR
jgi:hypothetical protein